MGRAVNLKLLRRLAEEATTGQPAKAYHEQDHGIRTIKYMGRDGKVHEFPVRRVTRILNRSCTQGFYKFMKKKFPVGTDVREAVTNWNRVA